MKMAAGCVLACGMAGGELTPGTSMSGFTVKSVTDLPEVKGRLVRMTEGENGGELAWQERDDDNKTVAVV